MSRHPPPRKRPSGRPGPGATCTRTSATSGRMSQRQRWRLSPMPSPRRAAWTTAPSWSPAKGRPRRSWRICWWSSGWRTTISISHALSCCWPAWASPRTSRSGRSGPGHRGPIRSHWHPTSRGCSCAPGQGPGSAAGWAGRASPGPGRCPRPPIPSSLSGSRGDPGGPSRRRPPERRWRNGRGGSPSARGSSTWMWGSGNARPAGGRTSGTGVSAGAPRSPSSGAPGANGRRRGITAPAAVPRPPPPSG